MPITPFHYPVAKIIHKLNGKISLSLPALIVGAMVPDLEVPFVTLFGDTGDRLVLHSLLGGLTLGTLIAVAFTVWLYPRVIGVFLPAYKTKLKEKCSFSFSLVLSCLIGVLSHNILDIANHVYNPIFWPFLSATQTPSPIVTLLGDAGMASLIIHGSMIALFVALMFNVRKDFWFHLFVE